MIDEKEDLKVITSDEIIKIISENTIGDGEKYCFILGAGASFNSGVPTGGIIAKKWIDELMKSKNCKTLDELNIKGLNENNLAEHYSEIFDKRYPEGTEKLAYKFFEKEMSNKQPSIGYVFFSEILATTKNNVVITTNFDTLTEDSLFLFTDKRPLVCGHESLTNFIDYEIDKPLVAKIHNDLFFKPKNSKDDISILSQDWKDALTKILNTYTPVFVGYGGNDPSLMDFLIELYTANKNVKKPYWCYRKSNYEDIPKGKIKNLLEKSGGKVSYIDGFDEFFMELYFSLDKEPTETIDFFKKKNQNFYNKVEQDIYEEIISLPPNDVRRQKLFSVLEKNKGLIYYLVLLSEKISKNKNNENDAEIEKIIKEAENNKAVNEFFYNNLGNLYSEKEKYDDAEKIYLKAIELNPNYFTTYNNLGNLYFEKENYDDAKKMYLKAIELNPNYFITYSNLGNLYLKKRNYGDPEKMYLKAIDLNQNYSDAYYNLGLLYHDQKEYAKAEKMYLKTIELDPNYFHAYNNLGALYYKKKKYADAEKMYKKAINLAPNFTTNTYYNLGILYENQKKYAEAEKMYLEIIKLDPNYTDDYNNFDASYSKQEKYDDSKEMFLKIIKSDPNFFDTYYNLGNLYFKQEKYDDAEKMYLKAIELNPNYFATYNNLGNLYTNQNKYDDAEKMYLKAIELNPNYTDAYNNLGDLYKTQNKTELAQKMFRKYEELINK